MAPREGTTRPEKLFPDRVRLRSEVRPVSVLNLSSPDKPSRSRLIATIEPVSASQEIPDQFSGQVEGSVRLLVADHEMRWLEASSRMPLRNSSRDRSSGSVTALAPRRRRREMKQRARVVWRGGLILARRECERRT